MERKVADEVEPWSAMERSGSHLPQELGGELFTFKRIETFSSINTIKGQSETAIQMNFVVGCRGTGKTCLLKETIENDDNVLCPGS
ncbi:MAG: hypothetical protein Q8N05_21590 [Bacteroidota bacterium]|nr:hypothetical protein [Bacteroidota bacterium]